MKRYERVCASASRSASGGVSRGASSGASRVHQKGTPRGASCRGTTATYSYLQLTSTIPFSYLFSPFQSSDHFQIFTEKGLKPEKDLKGYEKV